MSDTQLHDISDDNANAMTVDEILEGGSTTHTGIIGEDGTGSLMGEEHPDGMNVLTDTEYLSGIYADIRANCDWTTTRIAELVQQRADINDDIKKLRAARVTLERTVRNIDRGVSPS